jgi:hypothetical protein
MPAVALPTAGAVALLGLAVAIGLPPVSAVLHSGATSALYEVYQATLSTSVAIANPFLDVDVNVSFAAAGRAPLTVRPQERER